MTTLPGMSETPYDRARGALAYAHADVDELMVRALNCTNPQEILRLSGELRDALQEHQRCLLLVRGHERERYQSAEKVGR